MSTPSEVSTPAGDNNAKELNDFLMNTEEQRLASFSDWPFENDCNCIPSKVCYFMIFCFEFEFMNSE